MGDLSESEHLQLFEIGEKLDAVAGIPGSYGAILDAINRMTSEALVIPPEYFEPTEKAGSRPMTMPSKYRFTMRSTPIK